MGWYEDEEDSLVKDVNEGRITRQEFDKGMRELNQAMRDMAQEEAQEAYDRVMDNY